MNKQDSATLLSSIALILVIWYLLKNKKGFWWWILGLFFIIPAFGSIGWALGKQKQVQSA